MNNITNISHAQLKYFSKLTQKKYREMEGKFLIEGIHLISEALESGRCVEALMFTEEFISKGNLNELMTDLEDKLIPVFKISLHQLKKLSATIASQGVVGVVRKKEIDKNKIIEQSLKKSIIVALDDVSDPGNVGTIIRTCDWFGIDGVVLSKNTVELYNPKVLRATMGSIFHLPIITEVDLVNFLQNSKHHGFTIITTVIEGGVSIQNYKFASKIVIVLGNEARGLSKEIIKLADELLTIPKFGNAESLNVAIASAIILSKLKL